MTKSPSLSRYFLYEWLANPQAQRDFLRLSYREAKLLAEEHRKPLFTDPEPRFLLCGVGAPVTARTFYLHASSLAPGARIVLFDQRAGVLEKSVRQLAKQETGGPARVETCVGDALQMPFADGTFDWIETDYFLAFFRAEQLPQLMAEWRRVLKPGGLVTTRIFAAEDSLRGRFGERCYQIYSWIISAPCHVHSVETIQAALQSEKFTTTSRRLPTLYSRQTMSFVAFAPK